MSTVTRKRIYSNYRHYMLARTGYNTSLQDMRIDSSYERSRTGVKLDRWRERLKAGLSATTPMSAWDTVVVPLSPLRVAFTGSFLVPPGYPPDYVTETLDCSIGAIATTDNPTWSSPSVASADAQALTRAHAKLREQRNSYSGVTFLGELSSTIRQLRSPYRSLVTIISSYLTTLNNRKRGLRGSNHSRRIALTKVAADTWLETSFGLLPLISDVKGIAETIARFEHDNVRDRGVAVGYARDAVTASTPQSYGSYLRFTKNVTRTREVSVRYIMGLDASREAAFGSARRLAELSGFHPADFIPQIYNVLPWSWLVDYVTNLGDVIESSVSVQSNLLWCNRTVRQTVTDHVVVVPRVEFGAPHRIVHQTSVQGEYKVISSQVQRSAYNTLPWVPLQFSLPANPTQYLNVLAVFRKQAQSLLNFT